MLHNVRTVHVMKHFKNYKNTKDRELTNPLTITGNYYCPVE